MIDIKLVRENPDYVRKNLEKRGDLGKLKLFEELVEVDKFWRKVQTDLNLLRRRRNELTREISELKKQGKPFEEKMEEASKVAKEIEEKEQKLKELKEKERSLLLSIPNLLHDSVPYGKDENDNVEIRRWGQPPKFDFQPKDHLTILQDLGLIDVERGAKVAGHQFFYLKKELVLLDLAIQRFAIDNLLKKGFILINPPYMINRKAYEGMIDPSDFQMVTYKVEGEDLYLIATSEHPIGAMYMNEILNKDDLPLKFCGISPCFRKEVGAHGKYTRGLFRMHQFHKVEQFVFCLPEQSWEIHEELQRNSEELYQKLGLHYRVVNVCTGEIGTVAAKKYDIEVWMADGKFRECGSNSNCTDYQARRLNIRYREKPGQPPKGFVHTLNNTALATSRTIVAIVEQYQQKDGSVVIPEVLRPYMNGIEKLGKS
jgi:seryl-tRNA synthetase